DRRLDVDQRAVRHARAVHLRVPDAAEGAVARIGRDLGAPRVDPDAVLEVDRDPEVDADLADGIAEVTEVARGIAAGVADQDEPATAAHHLVDAEVVEVAA